MSRNLICKRITASLLAVFLFVACCAVNAAEVYTKQELEKFEENVRLLSAFGLLEKGREAATTITRGEFASVMLKYLGYEELAVTQTGGFSDVADPADPVYGMAQLRLMHGYPDGSFRPNENLLTEQAVKVLVNALGYYHKAESMGGYPAGYLSCGRDIELLKGTEFQQEAPLTYITLVQMMVNALTVKLMETNGLGRYFVGNDTWLDTRLNAQESDGILTSVGEASFEGNAGGGKNTITVDGKVYYTQEDYSGLLGDYVKLYANAEDEIIYLTQQRTTRQTFDAEVINGYADKTYTVETANGKEKKYRLAQNNQIFFNGAIASGISSEEMCPLYGSVTLVDNNRDGIYEVVHITSYQIYFVKGIDTSKMLIYYQNDNGETLDFSQFNEEDLTVVNAAGDAMKFDQILSDSVIRVAISKDKQKAKIIVSVASVTGTVTSRQYNDGMDEVTINDTSYRLTRELSKSEKVIVGTGGTFYLDSENIIAAVSDDASGYSYGYLDRAYLDEASDELRVRIFDSTGQLIVLNGASKMKIDGLNRQNAEQVLKHLKKNTGTVVKTVVRFKRNGNGELIEIDTPYNSAEDMEAQPQDGEDPNSLRLIYSGTRKYYTQTSNFAGKVNLDSNSIMFSISGDNVAKDYHALRKSDIPANVDIPLEAYSDSEDEFYAKLLFTTSKSAAGMSGNYLYGVVSKVWEGLNEDDEVVPIIHFMGSNGEWDLVLEEELAYPYPYSLSNEPTYSIEAGDILSLKHDGTNASNVSMVYKHSENLFPGGNPYHILGEVNHYIYGSVYSVERGFVNLVMGEIAQNGVPSVDQTESYRLASLQRIYKCTSVRGRMQVTRATEAEIADYLTAGENCSKAVVTTEWEYPNIMVIY